MASHTRPAHPITRGTTTPSRRPTCCDGPKWALTCANSSCDGCDGAVPSPSHPSQTTPREPFGSPATRPVTPVESTGLPLAPLPTPVPPPSLHYTVTPIDARGRLADRSPVRTLGWQPGQPITITAARRAILVTAVIGGAESITRQGHLRLPAHLRHAFHLSTGERLLVAAAPTPAVLIVHTLALLESIFFADHALALFAEAAR